MGPRVMVGDFNAITTNEESNGIGGSPARRYRFVDWLNNISMIDFGFMGNPFIWGCGNQATTKTLRHLDRAMANMD